jgi:MFS family permease
MTWLPMFLKTDRNLSVLNSGGYLAVIIFAFWCGCVVSGFLLDRIGRRKNIVLFALCCFVTVQCYVFLFAAGTPASLGALSALCLPETRRRSLDATNTSAPVTVSGNESARV